MQLCLLATLATTFAYQQTAASELVPNLPKLNRRPAVFAQIYPPDNHHREACRIIGNIKGNAALLAAFSFSALTAKELPGGGATDPMLQQAYVIFACLTLAFELVAVFVGQQLLYRMADGSFGVSIDGKPDPERTILGIMLSNYKDDFSTVRFAFLAGIGTMMCTIAVRAWATYEPPLATAVTCIFVVASGVMASSNRGTLFEFERVRLLDSQTVKESFNEADLNADGRLCAGEIRSALSRCGLAVGDVEELMTRCDACEETMTLDLEGFQKLVALLRDECYVNVSE